MKKRIRELYAMFGPCRLDHILETYTGELGIFGVYFGHKVCPKQRAKRNRAWVYILQLAKGDKP